MAACAIPLFFYTFTEKRQVEAVSRVLARKKAAGTMNEAEAGEFIEELKLVDKKTQERTYTEVAEILGWENSDAVRAFIAESDKAREEASTADVVNFENVAAEDSGVVENSEVLNESVSQSEETEIIKENEESENKSEE